MTTPALTSKRGSYLHLAPHQDACSITDLASYADSAPRPIAVDLFCGAGGLSLGLHLAGFTVVLGVDSNRDAVASHGANFGGTSAQIDLSNTEEVNTLVSTLSEVSVDLIAGAPPCQSFSKAGVNKIRSLVKQGVRSPQDPRGDLWRPFVNVVKRMRPRAVLVENVPDMALGGDSLALRQLVAALEALDYDVHTRILRAVDYGVPQHRQRLFVVGLPTGAIFDWPDPSDNSVTVRDAIHDLPKLGGGEGTSPSYYGEPDSEFQGRCRIEVGSDDSHTIYDHVARDVRADDLEAFQLMDSRTSYSELPPHLRRYRADIFTDKYKRLEWDGPSRSITAHIAKDGYWYIHPEQHRTLTVREAARIQTFPDWFRFAGYPSRGFHQIGEAVPPKLGEAVAKSIAKSLEQSARGFHSVNTTQLSGKLAAWLENSDTADLAVPWRQSRMPWKVLLGLLIFDRTLQREIHTLWPVFAKRWPAPSDFLNDSLKSKALKALGQGDKISLLTNIAERLNSGKEIRPEDTELSKQRLSIALALCGLETRLPTTAPVLRVATRVFGGGDDNGINGQLKVARLLGDGRDGGALASVLEVADRFCRPSEPRCDLCPIHTDCRTGLDESQRRQPTLI